MLSRAQICEALFGWEREVDDAAISMHVSRARKKLAAAGADPIATLWGMGYKVAALNSSEDRGGSPVLKEREVAGTREEGADGAGTCKAGVADARPPRMAHTAFLSHRALLLLRARRPRGVWLIAFTAFSMTLNAGLVYSANYGAAHANEAITAVQEAGSVSEASIPSGYRYAQVAYDGTVLATDLSRNVFVGADATASFRSEGASNPQTFGIDGTTYSVASSQTERSAFLPAPTCPNTPHEKAAPTTS